MCVAEEVEDSDIEAIRKSAEAAVQDAKEDCKSEVIEDTVGDEDALDLHSEQTKTEKS